MKPRSRVGKVAQLLFGMALGAALGLTFGKKTLPASDVSLLLFLLFTVAGWFLAVAVHECGHAVAGRIAGNRFIYMTVGPLKLAREGGQLRLRFLGKFLGGGFTCSIPRADVSPRGPMTVMIAGGPLASGLATGALYAVLPLLSGHVRVFLGAWCMMCLIAFVAPLIPYSSGGFQTDGSRLLMLARNGMQGQRWLAMVTLQGLSAEGVRPREFPRELIASLEARADDSFDGVGVTAALHSYALDCGDIATSDRWLTQALRWQEAWPKLLRSNLLIEAAYFTARHKGDSVAARRFFKDAGKAPLAQPAGRLAAEAAVLLAEGRRRDALPVTGEAMRLSDQVPTLGSRKMLVDRIAELQEMASAVPVTAAAANAD